jgi:gliding motility-associated-like protein
VTVVDANGCVAVASTVLTQPTQIVCEATNTNILCKFAATGTAAVSASGGSLPYTYNWTTGSNTPNINGLVAGTYVVTVIDAKNCTTQSTVTVTEPETALAATATAEDASCANGLDGSVSIFIEGGSPPYVTSLNGVDYGGAFTIPGLSAGTYVAYIADFYGCATLVPDIVISQPPAIDVELGVDTTIQLGTAIQLIPIVVNNQGVMSFSWLSDNANDSLACVGLNCASVLVTPTVQSIYYVTVTDAAGCTAEDYITVLVGSLYNIAVPTAFSPSGDPMNQMLHIHGESGATVLSFRVFDRWGNIVYEQTNFATNDMSIGWDGTWRGSPLDNGEYVWMLEAEFNNGLRKFFKGSTVLMR